MNVVDLHADIFTDIAVRRERGEKKVFDRIHFPRLKSGGIHAVVCVIWIEPVYQGKELDRFQTIFSHVVDDLKECRHAEVVSLADGFPEVADAEKVYVCLGMEGLTFIEQWKGSTGEEKVLHSFQALDQQRFCHAGFTWNEANFLATGTGCAAVKTGLTECGKFAVQVCEQLNWLVDVSHLNEQSFWDVYHTRKRPIMASHSNARALCNIERNLTDQQIKAIADSGGIIGLNAYGKFVDETKPTISRFVDHAVYIADLAGIRAVAFGFDFMDYLIGYPLGGNFNNPTKGLENVTMVPNLIDAMIKRGFTSSEIELICFKNALRFFRLHKRGI